MYMYVCVPQCPCGGTGSCLLPPDRVPCSSWPENFKESGLHLLSPHRSTEEHWDDSSNLHIHSSTGAWTVSSCHHAYMVSISPLSHLPSPLPPLMFNKHVFCGLRRSGLKSLSLYGSPLDGGGRGEEGCCLHSIGLVNDGPWWQGMRGQCVVDGDRDPAGGFGSSLDQLADVSFKGEVTALMLHHMYPIHPLQTQGNMSRGQRKCSNGAHEATLSVTHGTDSTAQVASPPASHALH